MPRNRISTPARRRAVTRLIARFGACLAALLASLLLAPGPADAAPAGGLSVSVQATDPLAPAVTLANRTGQPCQVASTALGTIALNSVTQDAKQVTPVPVAVSFDDAVDTIVAQGLRTLAPGESVTLPLPVVPAGSTGHALETVAWSASGLAIGSLYPVTAHGSLGLDLAYAPPPLKVTGAPLCPGGSTAGAVGPTPAVATAHTGGTSVLMWILIGVAGLVLILIALVILILMLRRRRRPPTAAIAALLLIVAGIAPLVGSARAAYATISVDPSLQSAWNACAPTFGMAGGDPGNLLPGLNAPGVSVQVIPANGDQTHEIALNSTTIIIFWNTSDHHAYTGGGNADPCTSLYHEFYHAHEDNNGGQDHSPCVTAKGNSGLPVNEVNATRVQNQLRVKLGLPPRKTYGDTPLPDGPCLPKDQQPKNPQNCTGPGCGDTNGDPHLLTFDGRRYDFQAAGEFVAARDATGAFQIQVRQRPFGESRTIAVNTAVAMGVAGDRVEIQLGVAGIVVLINGKATPLASASLPAGGKVSIVSNLYAPAVEVTWPDGSTATVSPIGRWGLHLTAQPAIALKGKLSGLLGNFDGDKTNDITPRNGNPITDATFQALYPAYADSWRIDAASSLFTYDAGASTATYTDRKFPDAPTAPQNEPGYAQALALCRQAGVTDADLLADCALDVTLTGQPDFAQAAADSQAFVTVTTSPGQVGQQAVLTVSKPGETAKLTFAGTGGAKVYVDIPSSDLPSQCGILTLLAPDGSRLNSACVINGIGYVDATLLPVTGQYTLALTPDSGATGSVHLSIIPILDTTGAIAEDGSPVTATITGPGAIAVLTFTGTAGQDVYVDIPASTLPSECGVAVLYQPDGSRLNSACIINSIGYIDETLLPVTGQYRIVVDPGGSGAGTATMRLTTATNITGTISIGGGDVIATITQPGQTARYTFTGTAGQTVKLDVPTSTLTNNCGEIELAKPDGGELAGGCVINGTGGIDAVKLPVSGQYAVVVDPPDHSLGSATLRLH